MTKKTLYIFAFFVFLISISFIFRTENTKVYNNNKNSIESVEEKKVLEIWIMPNSLNPENDLRSLSKNFTQKHNIDLKIIVLDWSSVWDNYIAALTGMVDPPDIIQIGTTLVGSIASTNELYDLTDIIDINEFLPPALETTKLRNSDKIISMPWFLDLRLLYYKKSICKNAGVNPEIDFSTWDSFEQALAKIKHYLGNNSGHFPLVVPGKNDWNVLHNFAPWIWNGGGSFLSDNLKDSNLNSEHSLNGIFFFSELLKKGYISDISIHKNATEIQQIYREGQDAITISGINIIVFLKNELKREYNDIGVALLPAGPNGRYSFLGGSNLAILKKSKNKETAAKYLRYLATPEVQFEYHKLSSMLPSSILAVEKLKQSNEDKNIDIFIDSLQYGRQYPCIPEWGVSERILVDGFSRIWDNVSEIKADYSRQKTTEIVNDISQKIRQALNEN